METSLRYAAVFPSRFRVIGILRCEYQFAIVFPFAASLPSRREFITRRRATSIKIQRVFVDLDCDQLVSNAIEMHLKNKNDLERSFATLSTRIETAFRSISIFATPFAPKYH